MAFADMQTELKGAVAKIPFPFCGTLINRAYREIRESQLWSFNIIEHAWASPQPINTGTVTLTQGLNSITFDAAARAAIAVGSTPFSLVTTRQFRTTGTGGIYNLLALDLAFSSNGVAYLDRPFMDPGGVGVSYQIYQVYYTPPVKDFLTYTSVRNPYLYLDMELKKTREWLDQRDPQRSWYQFPTHVIPFGRDQRQGQVRYVNGTVATIQSATLGYPLYELWGQPTTTYTYQCYGLRRGTDLVNPTDTLPVPIGDDLVLAKAYYYAYEWAEANKDKAPRSQGPDYKFLMKEKDAQYKKLLILYRKQDRETVNAYLSRCSPEAVASIYGYYNTLAGTAGPYMQI